MDIKNCLFYIKKKLKFMLEDGRLLVCNGS